MLFEICFFDNNVIIVYDSVKRTYVIVMIMSAENKIEITLPENTDSSSRSAYMIVEYSYKDEEGKWHNIRKWLYIAQTGKAIK